MRHTLPLAPQFYVTAPQPCPYLAGRMERKLFTALQGEHSQKLNDALKTLKDGRRVYSRGKGVYEIEDAYPPARQISASILPDRYRLLEIGDQMAVALTPEESRLVGMLLAGDAAQEIFAERMRELGSKVWELERARSKLEQRVKGLEAQRHKDDRQLPLVPA